jgi:hypothetical protein
VAGRLATQKQEQNNEPFHMKRISFKIITLALAISTVGYWSCQKENAPLSTTTVTTDSQQRETTEATDGEAIKAKIEAFERTLNNLKNGATTDVSMSVDETVWNIEALLNKTIRKGEKL